MTKRVAMLPFPPYFDETLWGANIWPLLSASYTGDLDSIASMVDEDPNRIRGQFAYYEPLHYAVRGGHLDAVTLLLERGAHPAAKGWDRLGDETPIMKAVDRERQDIEERLRAAVEILAPHSSPQERTLTREARREFDLAAACAADDRRRIESILAANPELATRIALYEAVHHGNLALAQWLIARGADVNGHMPWACWFTPLMHAVRYPQPHWELADLLLANGVSAKGRNGLGMTPLHIVTLGGSTEAAVWLLEHGADIDAIDDEFCSTPLGWAARWGREDMARLLLDRGADRRVPGEHAWAKPARWATKKGHARIAAML